MNPKNFHFNRGFYECGDDIMFWLNSLDTSEMEIKDLRSAIWHFILERRPNDTSGYSDKEKD
jgi:hypothetical protein